jgi:hypothetical protein
MRVKLRSVLVLLTTIFVLDDAHAKEAKSPDDGLAQRAARLAAAYPDTIATADARTVTLKNGRRLAFTDGVPGKSFDDWLARPSIDDMFAQSYDPGSALPPPFRHDPGRARNAEFFDAIYGDCRTDTVRAHLVDVVWLPTKASATIKATRINGVADRLAAISRELDQLPDSFLKYLTPLGGTYNCRVIAGTDRTSAHGHGIAIDLAPDVSDYWRWAKPDADGRIPYRNRVPLEIVAIFEKHGFIWGGRWSHFDTMHFEYRPELLTPVALSPARAP